MTAFKIVCVSECPVEPVPGVRMEVHVSTTQDTGTGPGTTPVAPRARGQELVPGPQSPSGHVQRAFALDSCSEHTRGPSGQHTCKLELCTKPFEKWGKKTDLHIDDT